MTKDGDRKKAEAKAGLEKWGRQRFPDRSNVEWVQGRYSLSEKLARQVAEAFRTEHPPAGD